MDRIRKALDLAREERARPAEEAAAPPLGTTVSFEDRRQGVSRRLPSIIYQKTRVFAPDPNLLENHRIVNPTAHEPAAAAYRMLRTQVLQRMTENDWRSIAVLSPGADDGKTTTAINLAASLASDQGHTVLLVDCDLRRPAIARYLGLTPDVGVDDVLRGRARIEDCLHHPQGFERLVVFPARGALEDSSEALSGPRGRDLAMELRERYPDRIVVFDLPPILQADDALAFMPAVECGLVVAAEGATRREDLMRCMELLRRSPIVGTVLNRSADASSAYG